MHLEALRVACPVGYTGSLQAITDRDSEREQQGLILRHVASCKAFFAMGPTDSFWSRLISFLKTDLTHASDFFKMFY